MLNSDEPKDRIIAAAMRLAEARGWNELTLFEIAAEAGLSLNDLRGLFKTKAEILAGFTRAVDDEVVRRIAPGAQDVPRDRLFDVLLTRFEVLAPYKTALRRIYEDLRMRPGAAAMQLGCAARSQYWMLQAAGINAEGSSGLIRVKGLLAVYANVFPVWLQDDDPGMARTMAALDRRLRGGEDILRRMQRVRDGFDTLMRAFKGRRGEPRAEPPGGATEPPPPPPPAPDIPGSTAPMPG
jgi:AcrR family transcriptional regulator